MSNPAVSVVMPMYNVARYLDEAILSIRRQTFRDFELLVVDDGSTDASADIADRHARDDSRVRVLRCPHRGIVNANVGVEAAEAKLIARMDSDDIALPARLEKQVAFMRRHPRCAAVGTWLTRTDPYGSPAGEQRPPLTHAEIDAALLRCDGSAIVQGTTMFRRASLLAAGGWRDRFGWIEDLDLYLRVAEVGELANLPEFLYRYRRHARSVCATHYDTMRARLGEMLAEAYARRGLGQPPPIETLRPDLRPGQSTAELYRNWACHAIHQGNAALARRHAASAIRREPWSIRSWHVMYWALAA